MINSLTEVNQVEGANLIYIIDDHRGLGFTNGKYYPIYERNEQLFVIDDLGRINAAVFGFCKTKLYKCRNIDEIHNLMDNKHKYIHNVTLRANMMIANAEDKMMRV